MNNILSSELSYLASQLILKTKPCLSSFMSYRKKESNKRKGKGRASKEDVDGEDKENVPQNKVRVSNREYLNEDSSDSEDSSPREKRRRLRECVTNNVEIR